MVVGVFIFYLFAINSTKVLKFLVKQSLENPVKDDFELHEKQNATKRKDLRNLLKGDAR